MYHAWGKQELCGEEGREQGKETDFNVRLTRVYYTHQWLK